ncbi:MAG: ribonuclease E/G [Lachnospiraceae bacterium]
MSENRLLEYTQEEASGESLVGALFLGRVERVLPQIKAAFVKLGLAQNGFLPIREQESFHQANGPAPLMTGQDVLVQVKEGPQGREGRVPDPGRDPAGPVRAADAHEPPYRGQQAHRRRRRPCSRPGTGQKAVRGRVGVIVRHAALFAQENEIRAEMEELEAQWNHLTAGAPCRKAPELLQKPVSPLKASLSGLFRPT